MPNVVFDLSHIYHITQIYEPENKIFKTKTVKHCYLCRAGMMVEFMKKNSPLYRKEIMLEGTGLEKQLRNPGYGLIPMLVFTLLVMFVDPWVAMVSGLGVAIAGVSYVKLHSRMLYDISVITFAFALVMEMLFPALDRFSKYILTEVIFVVALIASRLTRAKVISRLARNDRAEVRNYLSESFRVAFHTQYSLFFHLLLILVFFVFSSVEIPANSYIPLVMISAFIYIVIMVLETLRLRMLDRKLNKEEWLPVVTESGQVTGRVAKSVTIALRNKYLHPVVRVALIHQGRLYLMNRKPDRVLNPGLLDYPFEKYLRYKHDIEEAVLNSVSSEIGDKEIPLQFMLKYVFENEDTRRLILLYTSVVDDRAAFEKLGLVEGKLWTISQIDENMGKDIFSECFELEFEYLKNTALLKYTMENHA